mmetsp:Transcript_24110/g.56110  ORF Transcript_24110/g.56110 Transcript_24110/m.56110 type:complete len:1409 (+) Transcript_24110:52-4278(+)
MPITGLPRNLAEASSDETGEDHGGSINAPLCFLIIALLTGSFLHGLTHLIPIKYRPPSSVSLFLWGVILPWIGESVSHSTEASKLLSEALQAATEVDPHLVFYALLPPLLYESAAGLHWHVFRRVASSSIILAIPGVMVNVFFVTLFLIWGFGKPWKPSTAMLSGAILSATDPVAVVACLRALHAPKKLSSLIEGESLINDGSAVVLFLIAENMVEEEFDGGEGMSLTGSLALFLQLAVGGPLFGIAMAMICEMWLKKVHDDKMTEVSIVVSLFFATYFIGEEMLHVSGVLGTVFFGIYMGARGRFALDVGNEESLRAVVEQVAHFADEAIFVIAGSVTNKLLRQGFEKGYVHEWHILKLFALYLALHVFRAIVVLMFMPVLNRLGYGLQKKEATFLVFAGLRGAVGLALVLLAQLNPKIDEEIRVLIGFYISGFTCLTLCVNGTLARIFYLKLNMYPESDMRGLVLQQVMRQIKEKALHEAREAFDHHWLFNDIDLDLIGAIVPTFEEADIDKESGSLTCPSTPPVLVFREMLQSARLDHSHDEEMVRVLSQTCAECGNTFKKDAVFCRKCGCKRTVHEVEKGSLSQNVAAARVESSIPPIRPSQSTSQQPPAVSSTSSAGGKDYAGRIPSVVGLPCRDNSTVSKTLSRHRKSQDHGSAREDILGGVASPGGLKSSESLSPTGAMTKTRSLTSRHGSSHDLRRASAASAGGVSDVYHTLNQFAGGNSEYLIILLLQSTSIQYIDLYERKDLEAKPFNELSDAVTEAIDFANKESITGTTTKHLVKRLRTVNLKKVMIDEDAGTVSETASDRVSPAPSLRNSDADDADIASERDSAPMLCEREKSSSTLQVRGLPSPSNKVGRQGSMAFTLDPQIIQPAGRTLRTGRTAMSYDESPASNGGVRDLRDTDEAFSKKPTLSSAQTLGSGQSPPVSVQAPEGFVPGQVANAWTSTPISAATGPDLHHASDPPHSTCRNSLSQPQRQESEKRSTSKGLVPLRFSQRSKSGASVGGNSQSASAVVNTFVTSVKENLVTNNRITQESAVISEMSAWDIEWIRLHHYLSPKEPSRVGDLLPKFGSDFLELKAKLEVIYAYVEAHQEVVEDARALLEGAAPETLTIMETHVQMAQDSIWGLCKDPAMLRLAKMVLSATVLLNIVEYQLKQMVRGGCLSERDAKEMFKSLEHQRKGIQECHPQMLKVKLPAYALEEGKWSWLSLIKAMYRRRENVRKRVAAEKNAETMRDDAIIQGYCFKLNHGVVPQSSNMGDWMQRFFVLLRETKVLNYISEKKGGELIPIGSLTNLHAAWREEVPELGMSAIILEFPEKKLCVLGFLHKEVSENSASQHGRRPSHIMHHNLQDVISDHLSFQNHQHQRERNSGMKELDRWSEALAELGVSMSSDAKPCAPEPLT